MAHSDRHPEYIEGCFGCKVSSVGFDGGNTIRSTVDEHNAVITEHRSGRVDVNIRPKGMRMKTSTHEVGG
jgi:hypothetical protein